MKLHNIHEYLKQYRSGIIDAEKTTWSVSTAFMSLHTKDH